MSKKAEELALEVYPEPTRDKTGFVTSLGFPQWYRDLFIQGYEQAEKDTIEKAAEWWYQHLNGFLTEGLAKGVIDEFRNAMEA